MTTRDDYDSLDEQSYQEDRRMREEMEREIDDGTLDEIYAAMPIEELYDMVEMIEADIDYITEWEDAA